jgi:hypothetical protein
MLSSNSSFSEFSSCRIAASPIASTPRAMVPDRTGFDRLPSDAQHSATPPLPASSSARVGRQVDSAQPLVSSPASARRLNKN